MSIYSGSVGPNSNAGRISLSCLHSVELLTGVPNVAAAPVMRIPEEHLANGMAARNDVGWNPNRHDDTTDDNESADSAAEFPASTIDSDAGDNFGEYNDTVSTNDSMLVPGNPYRWLNN